MPGSAQPPAHIARIQRTINSAQAQHTASPRQVTPNEWTLYMATIIDPETVDGVGGPLGWFKLIAPKFLQSPMSTPFVRFKHVILDG